MALHRTNGELFTERRNIVDAVFNSFEKSDHGSRVLRRGRKFGRITKHKLSRWIFLLTALLSILLTVYGLKMFFQGEDRDMYLFFWYFVWLYTNSSPLSLMYQRNPTS